MNLLPLIQQRPMISAPEIAKYCNVSESTVHDWLKPLLESGQISKEIQRGSVRRTCYFAVEKAPAPPIERTLHRRRILSLFNPVEFA